MPGNRTDADRSPTVWLPAIQRSLNVHRLEDGKAGDPDRSGGPAPRQEVRHPDAPRFQLPGDPLPLVTPLTQALQSRRSRREYMRGPLMEAQLATILLYSCGIARHVPAYGLRAFPLHFVPSQGGLHPVETYVIINRLEAWRRGLYHYDAASHSLDLVDEGNLRHRLTRCCHEQDWIRYADAAMILVGSTRQVEWKYGPRSYRYIHVDAGLICQTVYLVATALSVNTCAVAAFDDEALSELLQLDTEQDFPVLLMTLGGTERK
jgi:SagB-type dehydrogenase family enzyme